MHTHNCAHAHVRAHTSVRGDVVFAHKAGQKLTPSAGTMPVSGGGAKPATPSTDAIVKYLMAAHVCVRAHTVAL
jgi:hypothetical protein